MERTLETENEALKKRILELEAQLASPSNDASVTSQQSDPLPDIANKSEVKLSLEEYKRYGRQMILPEIGIEGTNPFHKSSAAGGG